MATDLRACLWVLAEAGGLLTVEWPVDPAWEVTAYCIDSSRPIAMWPYCSARARD